MSANMENNLANQDQIIQAMEQQLRNFKKDSADRKTPANIKKRLQILDSYWQEFQVNHAKLCEFEDRGYTYFSENIYDKARIFYNEAQDIIQNYKPPTSSGKEDKSPSTSSIRIFDTRNQEDADERQQTNILSVDPDQKNIKPIGTPSTSLFKKIVSRGNVSKLEEMLRKQKSNFKALSRAIRNVDIESLSEKWEFEDVLKTIQIKWSTIDSLHWEIDSEMYSEDEEYEQEYSNYEQLYVDIKKLINSKMYSVSYRESFTPKIDIPTFSGNYHKWISFKDLFQEAVHNNKSIPSAQKMQLLKSKLKGEAERIIQHLNISSENYQVCWDILNHRYNNDRLIFTSHMNILLSIPTMQNQVDTHIKNMFDTTNECMNALKNLGIDVAAMGPTVVHLLTLKLDTQTLSEYTQSLDNPKALPVLADFLKFLENKYTALESTRRKHYASKSSSSSSPSRNKDSEHQFNKNNQSKSKKLFNMSLIRVSTAKTIIPKKPTPGIEVQYPCAWFNKNKNQKPNLTLMLVSANIGNAAGQMANGIKHNTIDLDVAKTFLYYFAKLIEDTLDSDWISYGIKIGSKDEKITPLHLIQENIKINIREGTQSTITEADYPWIAGAILGVYRLCRAQLPQYKAVLAGKITVQLKALCPRAEEMSEMTDQYMSWLGDKGYTSLVAVYDMFFHRFPMHKYANLRIGTTGSRFRDCAGILSYGYLIDLLGMPTITDVMDWVFIEQIGTDIDRMMDSDDELNQPFSYFPYHVDLGLVLKSAYSASANPYFFEWVHLIGAFVRSPRSMHAKHITDSLMLDLMASAACVAYAFSGNFTFKKVYTESGIEEPLTEDDEDDEQSGDNVRDEILKTRDPTKWCALLQSCKGCLPPKVKQFINRVVAQIDDPARRTKKM